MPTLSTPDKRALVHPLRAQTERHSFMDTAQTPHQTEENKMADITTIQRATELITLIKRIRHNNSGFTHALGWAGPLGESGVATRATHQANELSRTLSDLEFELQNARTIAHRRLIDRRSTPPT